MKTCFSSLTRCCCAAWLLTTLTPVCAQNPFGPGARLVDPNNVVISPEKPVPETWQKEIKDFKFDGITLGDVVQFLEDQVSGINFVVTPHAAEYALPPVRLTSATLEDVFTAIRIISDGEIQISPESATLVSVTRLAAGTRPGKAQKPCVAFSLSRYLQGKEETEVEAAMKDVESALEKCWKMLAEANNQSYTRPALSLHAPTKMLIAVGEPDQIAVIESIVRQLESSTAPYAGGGGGGGGGIMLPGMGGYGGAGGGGGGYSPGPSGFGGGVAPNSPPLPNFQPETKARRSTNAPASRK